MPGRFFVRITRWDGLISREMAAELCGVKQDTISKWISHGYGPKDARRKLPVAKREGRRIFLDPVEVAKAEHATRKAARRETIRDLQRAALAVRCRAARSPRRRMAGPFRRVPRMGSMEPAPPACP